MERLREMMMIAIFFYFRWCSRRYISLRRVVMWIEQKKEEKKSAMPYYINAIGGEKPFQQRLPYFYINF